MVGDQTLTHPTHDPHQLIPAATIPLHSFRFIMNAMSYLKPGGVAIHTMEFTLSNAQSLTQRQGSTSLWTKLDVKGLARDLCLLGYEVSPLR